MPNHLGSAPLANDGRISVNVAGVGTQHIATKDVYFTFASGGFDYDCIRCGAKCCRGHGFRIAPGPALVKLLASRPTMRFFLEAPGVPDDTPVLNNYQPACFFLDRSGLCSIHREHGYDAKPETCRLFPFNSFKLVNDTLIVAPHAHLCPLELVHSGSPSDKSVHSALLHAMMSQGITSSVMPCRALTQDAIILERQIVRLLETRAPQASSMPAFLDAQLALTYSIRPALVGNISRSIPEGRTILHGIAEALDVLPVLTAGGDSSVERVVIALTPYVRSQLMFRSIEKHGQRQLWPVSNPVLVPYAVAALYILARIACATGMAQVTFQTLSKLLNDHLSLISLLAHIDETVRLRPAATLDLRTPSKVAPYQRQYLRVARALLPGRQRRSGLSLATILREHNTFEGHDRILFLKFIARRLYGCIEIEGAERPQERGRPLRAALQRMALSALNDPALRAITPYAYEASHNVNQPVSE